MPPPLPARAAKAYLGNSIRAQGPGFVQCFRCGQDLLLICIPCPSELVVKPKGELVFAGEKVEEEEKETEVSLDRLISHSSGFPSFASAGELGTGFALAGWERMACPATKPFGWAQRSIQWPWKRNISATPSWVGRKSPLEAGTTGGGGPSETVAACR
jgi:hypothetical protein